MIRNIHVFVLSFSFLAGSCGPAPVDKSRFIEPDRLYDILVSNVRGQDELELIVDIDHARLAEKAESPMPPAHVLIWSDPGLEAAILKHQPLAAIDLPLRALAYEDQETGKAAVIANSFDYIENRYSLPEDKEIRARYDSNISRIMAGIPDEAAFGQG